MRLLLDTHVLIWLLEDPGKVAEPIRRAVRDDANEKLVSAASIWEAAIKSNLGRLETPEDLAVRSEASGYRPLPIDFRHATAAGALPLHHGDPFDRMLVAQAQIEGLTIATTDSRIARYAVAVLGAD